MCKFPKTLYTGESFAEYASRPVSKRDLGGSGMMSVFADKCEALDAEASDMEDSPSEVKIGVYKLVRVEKRMMDET